VKVTRRSSRRSSVTAREIMTAGVIATHAEESLADIATRMRDHAVGAIAIMDGEELKGILTERDLTRATADGLSPRVTSAKAYMTPDPVTIVADDRLEVAAARMVAHGIRHLPVVEEGRVVGIVSARDVLANSEPSPDLAQLAYEPW
jgi:CBS domain-containing protein